MRLIWWGIIYFKATTVEEFSNVSGICNHRGIEWDLTLLFAEDDLLHVLVG